MAAITTIKTVNTAVTRIRSASAQATTGQTDWLACPTWAHYAIFMWEWTAQGGTSPTLLPSLLIPEPITLDTTGLGTLKVAEHAALTALTASNVNERQTITLSAGNATDTFKLTVNGVESTAAVTIPAGGYANTTAAQIKTCLLSIPEWADKTASITTAGAGTTTVDFTNALGAVDIGAITITSKTGAANGSVAETTKGTAGVLVMQVGPGVLGIANDVTNSATVTSYVSLNAILPPVVGLKTLNTRTNGDETYTYTLTAFFRN